MILHNIGMVAANTSRSHLYITELIKKKILPRYILVLLNSNSELLPGQTKRQTENEIIKLLNTARIKYDISYNTNINSESVIDIIANRPEEVFIFSGYGGVLLKEEILDCGKKFLHIHGGYLPYYKGSTANYYSLIEDNSIGASAIFLTKEIDCGPILIRRKISPPN
ncbi:formyltransferase family protein [Methylophilaceae bacterium Uisw_099_01]